MIKDGFLYLAALIFAAAVLVNLPKIFKREKAQVFFNFAPPIVLIYLGLMLLCTMKVWDLSATSAVYKSVKNPILYAMLFIMLLRCDLKKIIKLGPKMLIGFLRSNFVNRTWILCFICNIPPALRRRFMESTRRTVRKLDGRRRQYARNSGST